ncbi:MAG: spermidine/putrescine ABC transporter substrate-binding protein [Actinomycetota bacterium]
MHPRWKPSPEPINRRDFIRRSAATAAGVPLASAILAACGKPGNGPRSNIRLARKDSPVRWPIYDDNKPIPSDLPIEKGATLKLYNWDQYIYKAVLDDFAKKYEEYDVDWEISTFNNLDEAQAKLRSTDVDFDVFFPTPDLLGRLTEFRLIRPLNHDYLPHTKELWPQFLGDENPYYDQGQRYSVPYAVYTTGIEWRSDVVDERDTPPALEDAGKNPYDLLWNPKYKGKIGMYDVYSEAIDFGIMKNAIDDGTFPGSVDLNTTDPAVVERATDSLIEMIDRVNVQLTINGAYEQLPRGVFAAHQAWSGDVIAAPYYGKSNAYHTAPDLGFWYPKDKRGLIGNDLVAVLKNARNPVLAHLFLDYLLEFEHAMKNFSWVGYQPPQQKLDPKELLECGWKWGWIVCYWPHLGENAIVLPEDFDKGWIFTGLSPEVDAMWHDNWERFASGV